MVVRTIELFDPDVGEVLCPFCAKDIEGWEDRCEHVIATWHDASTEADVWRGMASAGPIDERFYNVIQHEMEEHIYSSWLMSLDLDDAERLTREHFGHAAAAWLLENETIDLRAMIEEALSEGPNDYVRMVVDLAGGRPMASTTTLYLSEQPALAAQDIGTAMERLLPGLEQGMAWLLAR